MEGGHHAILRVVALAIAMLFLYAGIIKLCSPHAFIRTIASVPYFPKALGRMASVSIALIEVATAALIFAGSIVGVYLGIGALALFSCVASLILLNKSEVPCNCFGSNEDQVISRGTIYRNLAFILALWVTGGVSYYALDVVQFINAFTIAVLYLLGSKSYENYRSSLELEKNGRKT